jgi:hypothetical protein
MDKSAIVGLAFWLLVTAVGSRGAEGRLEGCPDPSDVASALTRLREMNWRDVDFALVDKIWPRELFDLGCQDVARCLIVGSKGRIIKGQCECCESFEFDVSQQDDGSRHEQLSGIIIFYSSHRRSDVVAAARTLAKSLGLDVAQLSAVGRKPIQRFQWDGVGNAEGTIEVLDISTTRYNAKWVMHLAFGRHVVDAPKPSSAP